LSGQKDRGAAKKTIVGYQSFLRLLAEGLPPKINVHEITDKEVRKHLAKYEKPQRDDPASPSLFRWTIKRDWRDGDPTDHDKTREIDDAISILSVPQTQKLLALCAADSECRPLVASIAIGLFAWLRTSEVGSLDWQNVHLTGKQQFIEVGLEKGENTAATHRFRFRQSLLLAEASGASCRTGRSRPLPRTA
jgi:integrase